MLSWFSLPFLVLFLLPPARCLPSPPPRPPSRYCRRCCDHLDSQASGSAPYYRPAEVRTVVNMTILKGNPIGVAYPNRSELRRVGLMGFAAHGPKTVDSVHKIAIRRLFHD